MSQPSDVAPVGFSRFRTDGLPADHRISRWEQIHASGLVGVRTRTLGPKPLDAAALKLVLPRISLARIRSSAHSVERSEQQILARPTEGLVLYVGLGGQGRFVTRGGYDDVAPGQGLICDADQVFTRSFTRGVDALLLTVPRSVLRTGPGAVRLSRPQRFTFGLLNGHHDGDQTIPSADPLVRELAVALSAAQQSHAMDLDAVESSIVGHLGQLLGTRAEHAGHAEAALAFIAAHARERGLSAEDVGQAIGLSPRQLSRVLSRAGTTLPRAIQGQRLQHARRLLADPQQQSLSMSEIADLTGFGSPEQFSRGYRQRFGVSPLRHRRLLSQEASTC